MNIFDFLEQYFEDNLHTPQYYDNANQLAAEVAELKTAAEAAGFSLRDLITGCGGDVGAYVLRQQNAYTDSEVDRKE